MGSPGDLSVHFNPTALEAKTLLIFLRTNCSGCKAVVAQLEELVNRRDFILPRRAVWLAVGGSPEDYGPRLEGLAMRGVTVGIDLDGAAMSAYGIRGVPSALALDAEGRLVDQTWNPYVEGWLYRQLDVDPPDPPVDIGTVGALRAAAPAAVTVPL
jgi:hypothetical protein